MDPKQRLESLIESVGAVAESLKIFYDAAIDAGFDEMQALILTGDFLKAMMPK